MKMTLSTRIIVVIIILGCVTVANSYVTFQHTQKVNDNILQVLNVDEPLEDTIQEMEISISTTAEAVLNYIQDSQSKHITTAENSKTEFEGQIADYLSMAESAQNQITLTTEFERLLGAGQKINLDYSQFYETGQEILALQDEQLALLAPLRDNVDEATSHIKELAQLQIDPRYTSDTGGTLTIAAVHLRSLFEMLDIVTELNIEIERLITTHNPNLELNLLTYSESYENAYLSYKSTAFSLDETEILNHAYYAFQDILNISEELFSKTDELNTLLEEFDGYHENIIATLDIEIQPLVNELTEVSTQQALNSSRIALGFQLIYGFFGFALLGGLLFGLHRWVISPVNILIGGIERYGAGSLTEKIDVKSDDELGQLAKAFNEMTTQIDETITTIKSNERELEELNVNLEAEMRKRMQSEQEMIKVARETEVDRVRSQFLSTITHELRTPLTSIKGYVDIIKAGWFDEDPEKITELLDVVTRNTDRLSTLTNDLLDIQRIETGRLEVDLKAIDLREVLNHCVQEIRPILNEKNQTLDTTIPDIPLMVNGDQERLTQVVMNLLNNASKFSQDEENISLITEIEKDEIRVRITDNGIGIKPADLERVFEALALIEKPIYVKGTGLGLSVSKGIIDLHNGRIWAESQGEWKGAIFTVAIPVWSEERDE